MALYTNMIIHCDNILIFQNQTIDVDQPDNDADVDTVPGGRQGSAPGPDVTVITIANAIPKGGSDYNFQLAKRNRSTISVNCQQLGRSEKLTGNFICKSYNASGGVGQAVMENITLSSIGTPAPIFE